MIDALFNPPLGHFILRVVLGTLLILHGFPKIANFVNLSGWLESLGLKPGKFWASVAVLVEFFGGILLMLGVFVQIIGILVAAQMLVIIWRVKWGKVGLTAPGGWELELLYLLAGASLALTGGGVYAIGNGLIL